MNNNKISVIVVIIIAIILCCVCCTSNHLAKKWGGSTTVCLEKGQKLVEITWKDDNIWYLTRPMREDEVAETYTFNESSSFGIFEGTITVKEEK